MSTTTNLMNPTNPLRTAVRKSLRRTAKHLLAEQLRPDTLGVNKCGNLLCRWGFFYTHGRTAEKYAQAVSDTLRQSGIGHRIEDSGMVWKPFRGGASTAQQSHFYVEVSLG
ncbi:MAG: hypothetical protein JXB13_06600 [Phycisphaerae bacterium]|nr:hypothetical protein [Phycisphaerae bacterium]